MMGDPTPTEPRKLWPWLVGLAAFLALCLCLSGVVGFLAYRNWKANQPTGEDVSIQYAGHVQPGESHTPYNSDPPTSGEHYPVPAQAGFYTEALPDEQLVHNLEHGYVIIWYNCDDLTSTQCEQLQDKIQTAMDK